MAEETPKRPDLKAIAIAGDSRWETGAAGGAWTGALKRPRDPLWLTYAGRDLALYDQILRDDQVMPVWQQRRLAVVSRNWDVEPGGDSAVDKAAADHLREQLLALPWDRITFKMLSGIFYGFGAGELMYRADGTKTVIDDILVRRPHKFRWHQDGSLRLMVPGRPDGEELPPSKFWTFTAGADDDDDPYGRGLAWHLYWPVWFKRNGLKFWAIWLEKFAGGTATGKVPPGASQQEIDRLLTALQALTTDSAVVFPEGVTVDILQAAKSAGGDYDAFLRRMDGAIAKVVLSQTMTTDDGSSKSQAEVHQDVKLEVVKGDADLVCESFNDGPATWLTAWNWPGAKPPRVYRQVSEEEDLTARAERDKTLYEIGWEPTEAYIQETYGDGYVRRGSAAAETSTGPGSVSGTDAEFAEAGGRIPGAIVARQADRLEIEAAGAIDAMMEPIRRLVDGARSLDEIRDGLGELFPDLPDDRFAALLGRSLMAAGLAGRDDVKSGR